jgi:preprotein translocase subunit SecB
MQDNKSQPNANANNNTTATGPQFEIQRIYIKDVSYEAPNTPQTFVEEWKPEVQLNLETKSNRLEDNSHEIILSVTATVSTNGKPAFVVEVQQAGIFLIAGLDDNQLRQMLGSFCPNILFPYARERISDLVVSGGFPQLILAPVNFDALYAQHLEQQTEGGTTTASTTTTDSGKVH